MEIGFRRIGEVIFGFVIRWIISKIWPLHETPEASCRPDRNRPRRLGDRIRSIIARVKFIAAFIALGPLHPSAGLRADQGGRAF